MSIIIIAPNRNLDSLADSIKAIDSGIDLDIWPVVPDKQRVTFAVTWKHPKHSLSAFPNLKAVMSMGAGADHLLSEEIPDIPVARVAAPGLSRDLGRFAVMSALNYINHTFRYQQQKKNILWEPMDAVAEENQKIGVMGLGKMGAEIARQFRELGFRVSGWSKHPKKMEGIACFSGNAALETFLNSTNILVNALPLTGETAGILNLSLFKRLSKPAYIIHLGRGPHLVEEDLVYALDAGILAGAALDVFDSEPLPEPHVFWNKAQITLTPHIAAITRAEEAAMEIVENYKRSLSGMPLLNEVDLKRGY